MSKAADEHQNQADDSQGFLSRWSKCKLQSQSKHNNESNLATAEINSVAESSDQPFEQIREQGIEDRNLLSATNEEQIVLCDKDMPDLNKLNEDSDYSGFLSPGVSDKLRKLALHQLFHGQSFNVCDGLDDYDEEFTSFESLGDIVTADMRFQMEEEAKRKLQLAAEEGGTIESDEIVSLDSSSTEDEKSEPTDIQTTDTHNNSEVQKTKQNNIDNLA